LDEVLFSQGGPLSDYFGELNQLADRLIDEMSEDEVLERTTEEAAGALVRQLMPITPALLPDRATVKREVLPGGSFLLFTLPFSGSGGLFAYSPTHATGEPITGRVAGTLTLGIPMSGLDSDGMEAAFWRVIERVNENLRVIGAEIDGFRGGLFERVSARLAGRRGRIVLERAVTQELTRRLSPKSENNAAAT